MPKASNPRSGSMQFWPRKRARSEVARVRSWIVTDEAKPLGFAGYKVGMTHVLYTDQHANSLTKGMEVSVPVTVIECPPIKVFGIRFYGRDDTRLLSLSTILSSTVDKELARSISRIKKVKKTADEVSMAEVVEIRLLVHTQPKLTGIGKKRPEIFELAIGGRKEDQLAYAKSVFGKDIKVEDVISNGEHIDLHAITKGKGFQGPVKRFGIAIKSHKSEKTRRNPGSLGPWKGQGHIMYRVAHAGQMGYHQRTEYNKWVIGLGSDPSLVNAAGGFKRYGAVKESWLLVVGSVAGASKRLIRFNPSFRIKGAKRRDEVQLSHINITSHQG
ncbi:MAG: 50S ribosomal protein L3 [DPANN group archaeon]|nr:50S ribosomal protein L3 [DPANN group archaeon]